MTTTVSVCSSFRLFFIVVSVRREHSGNLATNDTKDNLYLVETQGARVVGPPGLYDGTVAIAVGGAHYIAAKVVVTKC